MQSTIYQYHRLSNSGAAPPEGRGKLQSILGRWSVSPAALLCRTVLRDVRLTRCFPPFVAEAVRAYSLSVKEVIQPQVPLRLPCYDFAPVIALAFGRLVPCGFRHGLRALTTSMA